jgi:succinate dehydrogenase / fumarate reductase, cytochrome b subunit
MPQLVGLALGLPPQALGLERHVVSTQPVLEKLGVG